MQPNSLKINSTDINNADGKPKDYSTLDGCYIPRRHKELPLINNNNNVAGHNNSNKCISSTTTLDLRAVVRKLEAHKSSHKSHHIDAMKTLSKHYSDVFKQPPQYKVYIQYHDIKETFIIKIRENTLGNVLASMPKRGQYRLFFKDLKNTCEELTDPRSLVPFHEKDDFRNIYCHAFPTN